MNKENPLKEFDDFVNIVKRLRKDCPWDRIQTHLSLRRCLLEETYEVLESIDENNMPELKKELGKMKDLFHSEQLEALRHHFPNISKAMEEGKDLLKQITRSRGFGMGM